MGYCSVSDFEKTLAQTLTSASPNPATLTERPKLADLGKKLNLTLPQGSSVGTYSLSDVNYYIRQAQSMVDAALSQQYVVPIRTKGPLQIRILSDVDEYTDEITVTRPENLTVGDQILLIDGQESEQIEIATISGNVITPLDFIIGIYQRETTRVLLIKFPDPIPYITAKLACAMFYDKWARAQAEPMKTEFGETLRKEATAELNNIREGRTILHGIDRIGSRFVNPTLYDRYGVKGIMDQDGSRSDQGRA